MGRRTAAMGRLRRPDTSEKKRDRLGPVRNQHTNSGVGGVMASLLELYALLMSLRETGRSAKVSF